MSSELINMLPDSVNEVPRFIYKVVLNIFFLILPNAEQHFKKPASWKSNSLSLSRGSILKILFLHGTVIQGRFGFDKSYMSIPFR